MKYSERIKIMIIKTWKFENFKTDMPKWVQENSEKRRGSSKLWVYSQRGEIPADEGNWISINLRGHVDVHTTQPIKTNVLQEVGASVAFVVLAIVVLVVILAM
tara:strand:- start:1675 stop:1983 length:309 start_codon:yes stop_codon:yes gene_type:complete